MKRRRRGTGSIIKTPDGRFRALFPFQLNKREDIDGSPFESHAAAERALDALLAALNDADAVRGGMTLRKLGEKALAQRDLDGYRGIDAEYDLWNLRVESWERCGMPASSTTRGDVKAWLAGMRNAKTNKPLATQTRRNALNLLRAVYAYGVDHEIVTENPCDGIKIKDHGRTNEGSTYLSLHEVEALVSVATDPGVALKVGTGMRSGELRSLRWEDVHDEHITVRYGSPDKPPKNGKVRDVPILPLARAALDELRELFGDETPSGIVLRSATNWYRARGQVFDRDDWKSWLKAAKIKRRVRPHDLRHTCATLLLTGAWGDPWSYEAVKEMLGHSSVKVTERYARATGTLAQKAAKAMAVRSAKDQSEVVDFATQAREMIQRRGSDSNRRMTVLQSQHRPQDSRGEVDVQILARSFTEAVALGDPLAIAKGLQLAGAVWPVAVRTTRERTA